MITTDFNVMIDAKQARKYSSYPGIWDIVPYIDSSIETHSKLGMMEFKTSVINMDKKQGVLLMQYYSNLGFSCSTTEISADGKYRYFVISWLTS